MARRSVLILLVCSALLLCGFMIWRYPAPSWHGQLLQLRQPAGENLDILMLGDTGTGATDQFQIAAAMESYCQSHKLSAVFLLGDNFYPKGVKDSSDPQWQQKFLDPYGKPCLSHLPFYAVLGNHDYKGRAAAQIDYSEMQNFWHMPHRFYSVQFGQLAKVIAIDSNILDVCGSATHCTIDFLREALSDTNIPLRIVIGHHPISSSSSKYSGTLQGWVLQKLLCNQRITYISGHSHHIEHRQVPDCSLELFIAGGGGASLYDVHAKGADTKFALSAHAFLSLQLSSKMSTFTYYDSHLQSLYSYTRKN